MWSAECKPWNVKCGVRSVECYVCRLRTTSSEHTLNPIYSPWRYYYRTILYYRYLYIYTLYIYTITEETLVFLGTRAALHQCSCVGELVTARVHEVPTAPWWPWCWGHGGLNHETTAPLFPPFFGWVWGLKKHQTQWKMVI